MTENAEAVSGLHGLTYMEGKSPEGELEYIDLELLLNA